MRARPFLSKLMEKQQYTTEQERQLAGELAGLVKHNPRNYVFNYFKKCKYIKKEQ